jgi:CRISPR system Cascade subunit CasB
MTVPTSPTRSRDEAFVAHLEALVERDDRAALAALRRGLGRPPGTVADVQPHVARFLPDRPSPADDAYYLVASLFALHPQGSWRRTPEQRGFSNLGASFALLAASDRARGGSGESVGKRVVALLNAHAEDLPEHLRHAVSLLKAHDVKLEWRQLLRDLRDWEHESRRVQRNWSRAYWGTHGAARAEHAESEPVATTTAD